MGLVCPPMFLGAIQTAGLPWYGRLPAILAEACVFQLAACLNGACSGSFLPFLGGETYSLRLFGCFRLCGSGDGF